MKTLPSKAGGLLNAIFPMDVPGESVPPPATVSGPLMMPLPRSEALLEKARPLLKVETVFYPGRWYKQQFDISRTQPVGPKLTA
jgi:hypothetical protein